MTLEKEIEQYQKWKCICNVALDELKSCNRDKENSKNIRVIEVEVEAGVKPNIENNKGNESGNEKYIEKDDKKRVKDNEEASSDNNKEDMDMKIEDT